ncbi:hypothetical protein [Novosphingobium decolorationis]|uniref:Uncharacterized protein n=1 Tax=Novosphingobium decolorationis TaxID=2698673 RepID=A0ABX8E7K8_9SPHN|nr:hypothetical protein [Novosphingobium decolorationis]QVM85171.1 hypothetical protein HT578_17040 [Novosphingobium decolorationis]
MVRVVIVLIVLAALAIVAIGIFMALVTRLLKAIAFIAVSVGLWLVVDWVVITLGWNEVRANLLALLLVIALGAAYLGQRSRVKKGAGGSHKAPFDCRMRAPAVADITLDGEEEGGPQTEAVLVQPWERLFAMTRRDDHAQLHAARGRCNRLLACKAPDYDAQGYAVHLRRAIPLLAHHNETIWAVADRGRRREISVAIVADCKAMGETAAEHLARLAIMQETDLAIVRQHIANAAKRDS